MSINTLKCPKCESRIDKVLVLSVSGSNANERSNYCDCWAYGCPHCQTILSVQADPFIMNDEIRNLIRHVSKQP